jgi:hypothetical protein
MFKLGIVSLVFLIALMIVPINFVSAQSGNLYVDNDYGFKIKYPQGWEVTENPVFGNGGSGIVAFKDTSSNSEYRPNFHITYKKDLEVFDGMMSVSDKELEKIFFSSIDSSNNKKILNVDIKKFEDRLIMDFEQILSIDISNTYEENFVKMKKHGVTYYFDNGSQYSIISSIMQKDYDYANSKFERSLQTFVVNGYENSPQRVLDTSSESTSSNTSSKEGGGCLIATAAYGSEMAPQVQLLREIRDNQLLNTESGSIFMNTFNDVYYSFSPTIADMERENPMFKEAVKLGLTPMLSSLAIMENAESESEVLGLGLLVITLNLGMYIGVPVFGIMGIRKKIQRVRL